MKKNLLVFLMFSSSMLLAQPKDVQTKYAVTITAADLYKHLSIVAGNEFQGRETATEGQRLAATYIENYFKSIGLKPGNNTSYQQSFPIYQDNLKESSLKIYNHAFAWSKHYAVNVGSAQNGNTTINDVVFVSYGMTDSSNNNYENLDVKDKWVMMIDASPADIDKSASANRFALFQKLQAAQKKAVKGIFLVSRDFDRNRTIPTEGNMYMKSNSSSMQLPNIVSVSTAAAASILTRPLTSFSDLKNIKVGNYKTQVSISINKETTTISSTNVLGVLEGTDKKDEYVFITAHYDHLGMRGSEIFYGADDDGSGTVSVLELAEAFTKAKAKGKGPRRSIVFMAVSGEEKGLWGSEYYGDHPIFPLEKTTVDLNIDMVGRIDPKYKGDSLNYVYTIGEDKLSSDLQTIQDKANQYIKLELDRRYNDPKDPNRFYYRSDHYNFAKHGVPIIFYFNGTHADYHKSSDTVDKINFPLMEKRVRLVFHTAWEMANRDEMLKRDIKLNMPAR